MLQILTNSITNVTNACECLMNEMITLRVFANIFCSSIICQHLSSEHLVSYSQVVSVLRPKLKF